MNLRIKNIGAVLLTLAAIIPLFSILISLNPPKVLADDPETVLINSPTQSQVISSSNFSVSGNMMVSPYANVKLDILLDGVPNQVVTTDGGGNWTANFTGIADGLHTVSAKLRKLGIAAIVNGSNNNVQLYEVEDDILGQTITSTNLAGTSARMALKPGGAEVWIPILDNKIQVYDNANRLISQTIAVDGMPIQIVFNTDGTKAYAVSNVDTPKIIELNTTNYTVTQEIPLVEAVNRMVISPDGSKIYLLNDITANITVVNTTSSTIADTFSVGDGVLVTTMAINNNGTIMYVLFDTPGLISSFNTSDFSQISSDTITSSGLDMVLNSDNTNLYFLDNTYKYYNLPVVDGVFDIDNAYTSTLPDLTSFSSIFLSEAEDKLYVTDPVADSLQWLDALSTTPTPTIVSDPLLNANTFGIAMPDLTTPQTLTTVNFSVVTGSDITPPTNPGTPNTVGPTSNRRPTWTWTPSTDAFGIHWYSYDLSGDAGFAGIFETGAVFTNSFTPGNDLPDGTWYFRVMAWDNNDNHTSYFPDSGTVVFTATLNQPTASSAVNSVPINYSFPQSVLSGSKKIIFTPTSYVGTNKVMTMVDNNTVNFLYNPLDDPLDYASVSAANFDYLPEGTYTVSLQYTDASNYVKTISKTNVKVDVQTQVPTLISPEAGSTHQDYLPIQFIVPETPLAGSLKMYFLNTDTSQTTELTLNTTGLTPGVAQGFNLDTLNLSADSHITSINPAVNILEHGKYFIQFGYQDSVGNPASSMSINNVNIGYVGPHIRVNAPTTSSSSVITDTQITVISEVNILAANVVVDSSTTASYSDLNCTQTSAKKVDCTVKITSSGNFVLKATDSNATTTKTTAYTINTTNNQNQESAEKTNESNTTVNPVSSPVKTVKPVSFTTTTTPVDDVSDNTVIQETADETPSIPLWVFIPVFLLIGGAGWYIKKKGQSNY